MFIYLIGYWTLLSDKSCQITRAQSLSNNKYLNGSLAWEKKREKELLQIRVIIALTQLKRYVAFKISKSPLLKNKRSHVRRQSSPHIDTLRFYQISVWFVTILQTAFFCWRVFFFKCGHSIWSFLGWLLHNPWRKDYWNYNVRRASLFKILLYSEMSFFNDKLPYTRPFCISG